MTKIDRKAQKRQYYLANRDRILQQRKLHYDSTGYNKSPAKKLAARKYYLKTKESRTKVDYSTKPVTQRIRRALRTRMSSEIPKQYKMSSREMFDTLLGCTIEHLITHLQKQFTYAMRLDNFGRNGWHIDHIVPCSLFDFTKIEQQKACFNYCNLQPMWEDENIKKSNKLEVCPI